MVKNSVNWNRYSSDWPGDGVQNPVVDYTCNLIAELTY